MIPSFCEDPLAASFTNMVIFVKIRCFLQSLFIDLLALQLVANWSKSRAVSFDPFCVPSLAIKPVKSDGQTFEVTLHAFTLSDCLSEPTSVTLVTSALRTNTFTISILEALIV